VGQRSKSVENRSDKRGGELLPFAALSASYFAHLGIFSPYLSLWLKDIGLSIAVISVLASMQAATRIFAPYGWGWLSDTTGQRVKILRYSAIASLVAAACLWWRHDSAVWIAVVLVVMLVHTSAMMPMNEAAMAQLVSQGGSFDARRYGRARLWGSLGFLVAVMAAGAGFEKFGIVYFPLLCLLSMCVLMLSTWGLPNIRQATTAFHERVAVWPILRQRAVYWLFIAMFLHVLAHMGIYIYLSLYLDELGYGKTTIGLLWAASVVAEIAWFYTQGRWLPRLSLSAWLVLAAAVTALRMGITAAGASVLILALLAQSMHAITFAAHHTACVALLSHHFPGHLRGRGQALYTVIGYGLTGVLGGVVGGSITTHGGLSGVFWVTLGVALAATAAAYKVWRLQHPRLISP
jgi:MFS transporter, PPP family, 3-phenylpropionic acid transporter